MAQQKPANRALAREAAEAHSNLNVYAGIVSQLEGGLLYGGRDKAAQRIIAICKAEMGKELAIFDKATARISETA